MLIHGKQATNRSGTPLLCDAQGRLITSSGGVDSGLPYGADEMVITNVPAGPSVIVYKLAGVTLKTRTLTYTNAGASITDVLTHSVDA